MLNNNSDTASLVSDRRRQLLPNLAGLLSIAAKALFPAQTGHLVPRAV
jgi:hypothetical protein